MLYKFRSALAIAILLVLCAPAVSQEIEDETAPPPELPTLEEVQAGRAVVEDFIPTDYQFRIGVVGKFTVEMETATGPLEQIKTPLILINPANGAIGVYAKNFPARILANSLNPPFQCANFKH